MNNPIRDALDALLDIYDSGDDMGDYPGTWETARAALSASEQGAQPEVARVYLVPTGETHSGAETYTRHEGMPPPLCDSELLYTRPQPVQMGWYVYFPDEQRGEFCHDLEELVDDLTNCRHDDPIALYDSPQPVQEPLTDEQIRALWDEHVVPVFGKQGINPIVFARAVERAHGIGSKA